MASCLLSASFGGLTSNAASSDAAQPRLELVSWRHGVVGSVVSSSFCRLELLLVVVVSSVNVRTVMTLRPCCAGSHADATALSAARVTLFHDSSRTAPRSPRGHTLVSASDVTTRQRGKRRQVASAGFDIARCLSSCSSCSSCSSSARPPRRNPPGDALTPQESR